MMSNFNENINLYKKWISKQHSAKTRISRRARLLAKKFEGKRNRRILKQFLKINK